MLSMQLLNGISSYQVQLGNVLQRPCYVCFVKNKYINLTITKKELRKSRRVHLKSNESNPEACKWTNTNLCIWVNLSPLKTCVEVTLSKYTEEQV